MRNILLVGWREFWQQVRSRGFVLTTVGLPILLIGIWALTGALDGGQQRGSMLEDLAKAERPDLPVGYVDKAGLVQSLPPGVPKGLFVAFPDEAAAATALEEKRIGAYYVLSADYLESGEVKRVALRLPLMLADRRLFEGVIDWNLLPGRTAEEIARLQTPFGSRGLQFVPIGDGSLPDESSKGSGFAPFIVAIVITMPLFMAGSYLLQGVAQEKENRVIEVLLVSLRPWQLLAGKLLGLGTLTIVQFGAWLLFGGLMTKATGHDPVELLRSIDLSAGELALVVAFAAGGFLLYATLMAGLGAVAPNVEATRMWAFLLGSPMMLPLFLAASIAASPSGLLAVVLSIMPFSSPVGMLMRLMATTVPAWEVALSLVLLAAASAAMLLVISRLFRASTLLSGQPIAARRFWEAVRTG